MRFNLYGNINKLSQEPIRRDQEERARKRLRELVEEGLSSGPSQVLRPQRIAELRKQALGKAR